MDTPTNHPTNIASFEKRRLMQALNANAPVAGRTGALSTQVIGRVDLRRWLRPKRAIGNVEYPS
jgi:hypothetical protein